MSGRDKSAIWTTEPLLLIWLNCNTSMDDNYIHYKVWNGVIYPTPNFNYAAVGVWEWDK